MTRFAQICPGGWAGNYHPEKILSISYKSDGSEEMVRSHGICTECKEAMEEQLRRSISENNEQDK